MNADEHVSACDRLFLRTKLVRPRAGTFAEHLRAYGKYGKQSSKYFHSSKRLQLCLLKGDGLQDSDSALEVQVQVVHLYRTAQTHLQTKEQAELHVRQVEWMMAVETITCSRKTARKH